MYFLSYFLMYFIWLFKTFQMKTANNWQIFHSQLFFRLLARTLTKWTVKTSQYFWQSKTKQTVLETEWLTATCTRVYVWDAYLQWYVPEWIDFGGHVVTVGTDHIRLETTRKYFVYDAMTIIVVDKFSFEFVLTYAFFVVFDTVFMNCI